jgi:hypothetical protein
MTTENTAKADATPAEAGLFASLIAKGLATLTPTERTELMASAAVQVGTDIAKAESTLSDDHGTIRVITDTWTSGDEGRAKVVSAHGPGSSANGGVPVGPEQQASGGGAQSMEREYSRFAAQTAGLQTATEALGRDISAGRAAMKSILEAVKGQGLLIEAMRGGAATVTVPDNTAIQSMIDTAIAKAVADINRQTAKSIAVLAKKDNPFGSEDEGDDAEDDDEADDDEKSAAVIKSDIDAERMAEGDAEATSKAIEAATLRVLAKCRVKWASRRLVKADEAAEKDRPKTAAHMIAKARFNLAKAVEYVNTAKELRDGDEGPSTAKILSQIAKSKAALPKAEAAKNNQDKWPDGKGEGDAAKGTVVPQDAVAVKALQDAVEKIAKAADGFGMLQASIGQVMNTLTSRGTGEQGTLPPTFALAKSSADDLTTRESEIMKLADTSVIDFDTLDKARDVIGLARSNVPPELLNARMARLPPVVREILTRAA